MAPTYYVIELTARWLTVLLVALALIMVLAFVFGYGAAWSVLTAGQSGGETPVGEPSHSPTPTPVEMVITAVPEEPPVQEATRVPQTATPEPEPTATPAPKPTERREQGTVDGFLVQVLASSKPATIEAARSQLSKLGFGAENQRVETARVAGGSVLHKLRIGPFPDRESADRVVERMRVSGFPDAWIVAP
jgi:cell division septation protein DedD